MGLCSPSPCIGELDHSSSMTSLEWWVREAVRTQQTGQVLNNWGEFNRFKLTSMDVDMEWEKECWEQAYSSMRRTWSLQTEGKVEEAELKRDLEEEERGGSHMMCVSRTKRGKFISSYCLQLQHPYCLISQPFFSYQMLMKNAIALSQVLCRDEKNKQTFSTTRAGMVKL